MLNDLSPSRRMKFRVVGTLCVAAGVGLAIFPELLRDGPPPEGVFEAVEARARSGFWIAFGLFLLMWWRLRPWRLPVSSLLTALPVGYLISRSIGIGFEGSDDTQRLWLITEAGMAAVMGGWHWWERHKAAEADAERATLADDEP